MTPQKKIAKRKNPNCVLEIFGRRVLWIRLGRSKHNLCRKYTTLTGKNNLLIDLRSRKLFKLKKFKDVRRANKVYYYDWGEIDRLIYKYVSDKKAFFEKIGMETRDVSIFPDELLDIRNRIIEMLFNLVNTIIYTHSFHQQMDDQDLFQDSIEKLIHLLDYDKHNPIRGTSFTFFTISLKNMIFTQLKKQKRYAINYDTVFPAGGDDEHHHSIEEGSEMEIRDLVDIYGESRES
jgi:hypothetical protein